MKNKKVRRAMIEAGISQLDLANILVVGMSEMSVMLKYELARQEQDEIVAKIREYDATRKRGA